MVQLFYLIKVWHTLTCTPFYGYFGHVYQGGKIKKNNENITFSSINWNMHA